DELVLRRVLSADGRSRAFVNEQPVAVALLRELGDALVEVHGQHDGRGLLQASRHRALLDAYGRLEAMVEECRAAWRALRTAEEALAGAEAGLRAAQAEEDYLRHVSQELDALDPQPGEEEELAQTRALLREVEKIGAALREAEAALSEGDAADTRIRLAQRALERAADKAQGRLDPVLEALDRTAAELAESLAQLEAVERELDTDPRRLEQVEERLFDLREISRKHRTTVDALPALRDDFAARLAALDGGARQIEGLRAEAREARARYRERAEALSKARAAAARRLDAAVLKELAPLALDKARFETRVARRDEADWGPDGLDQVAFAIATNPGQALDALNRVASGGELSRVMLALKVALAQTRDAHVMIFDEVDQGIGGAVADKVGERLARLAGDAQVLVVTHSPQVAARADHHWRIVKQEMDGAARTGVQALEDEARRDEIARMLAGATVTSEARAAADSLILAGRA
ncbi:MAG TPA: DNA repair protein RecN, partial [Alphaproteobacteria bacterium]|nr:DNA repair protein RecN [Alphaproteobacteria bacterium]